MTGSFPTAGGTQGGAFEGAPKALHLGTERADSLRQRVKRGVVCFLGSPRQLTWVCAQTSVERLLSSWKGAFTLPC